MDCRPIFEPAERERFVQEYEALTSMTVSRDYVRAAEVHGIYRGEELVGGFCLAMGQDMVWPKLVDAAAFDESRIPLQASAELNLVWAKKSFKKTGLDTIRLWWVVCDIVAKAPVKFVTFACENTPAKKNLMSRYEIIAAGLLYSGPINKYQGRFMKVWWSSPFRFKVVKVLYIPEYVRIAYRQYKKRQKALQGSLVAE